jgi:hypothetical protein
MCAAGLPDGRAFATRGRIARDQAGRAPDAGPGPGRAAGDEVHGRGGERREVFGQRDTGHALAVGRDIQPTASGRVKMRADRAPHPVERAAGTAATTTHTPHPRQDHTHQPTKSNRRTRVPRMEIFAAWRLRP